jgi:hypothetical protein
MRKNAYFESSRLEATRSPQSMPDSHEIDFRTDS